MFYDLMTTFWAVVWGAAVGFVVYALADGDAPASNPPRAWLLGGVATVATVLFVWAYRQMRRSQ